MSTLFDQGHACIIGVGADLPNTVDDAIGLTQILTDPTRCGYPVEQVRLLTQDEATRANILDALDHLAQATTRDSTVIIYFSGHGCQVTSPTGEFYYLMPFGYNLAALYKTAISDTELTAKLRAIPAKQLLLLLDCCHAGGLGSTANLGYEAEKSPLPPEAHNLFSQGEGRFIIASSRAEEKSFAGRPYSEFTQALIEALAGQGVSQKDGYVRVMDLALYTRQIVSQRTGDRQNPILNDFKNSDNFILAYYAGGDREPKGVPFTREAEIKPESSEFSRQSNQHVEASGDRSVAIGGNAQGATIITGDGNSVGDRNIVQNVTQKGKYNINLGNAQNLRIGDIGDFVDTDSPQDDD